MRPAMKFIKHSLRGFKHLKRTEGKGLQETIEKVENEVKKLKPLKFKSR